ncbi:hypothetical protein Tco_0917253 [Tanacetum coccineum]
MLYDFSAKKGACSISEVTLEKEIQGVAEDEEYAMVVRDFKYPNHLLGDCLKPPKNKDQKAFCGGYCKDIGKKEEERNKEEACCIAIETNEVNSPLISGDDSWKTPWDGALVVLWDGRKKDIDL